MKMIMRRDSTKLPLSTQDKKGVSAMKLHRHLGIMMQVMMERDREHPLSGWKRLSA